MSKSTSNGKIGKRYDAQFKSGAVRMVTEEGLSQCEVARRLGVAGTTVCAWVRQLAPNGRLTDQEMRIKLRELEQENRRLKMEREILKKAATFFASESR
jgi:transposase